MRKDSNYKFILVDLDDPTMLLPRFMTSLNKILAAFPGVTIDTYACASSTSIRLSKLCREFKVELFSKPLTAAKVQHLKMLYNPDSESA